MAELRRSEQAALIGVSLEDIGRAIFGEETTTAPTWLNSPRRLSIQSAAEAMLPAGVVQRGQIDSWWRVPSEGVQHAQDPLRLWITWTSASLTDIERQVLKVLNDLSATRDDNGLHFVQWVDGEAILQQLPGLERSSLNLAAHDLQQRSLVVVHRHPAITPLPRMGATYKGLATNDRRTYSLDASWIDNLVAEWETTSVDFKRELYVDQADQKSEFVKDILGVVNTQASGKRLLVVGFDDRTHRWASTPDPSVNEDRLQQVLNHYTDPKVLIRYRVIDHPQGAVVVVEALRDPRNVPYRVAEDLGSSKKRIMKGNMYVRHGC